MIYLKLNGSLILFASSTSELKEKIKRITKMFLVIQKMFEKCFW